MTAVTSTNQQHEFNLNITDESPVPQLAAWISENRGLDITSLKIILSDSAGVIGRNSKDEYRDINFLLLDILRYFQYLVNNTLTHLKIQAVTVWSQREGFNEDGNEDDNEDDNEEPGNASRILMAIKQRTI